MGPFHMGGWVFGGLGMVVTVLAALLMLVLLALLIVWLVRQVR